MNKTTKIMGVSLFTNIVLSITKVVVGFLGNSKALIAGGMHSLSDLITDIVAIIGSYISDKPADIKHPYGHDKTEYLISFMIGMIVLFLGLGLISNVVNKEILIPQIIVIFVSIWTIISKYILSLYLIKKGKQYKNVVLTSSGQESRADVLSSIVVLISSILMQYSNVFDILKYTDIVASVIVGILIVITGFNIIKDSISMILGEQETDKVIINDIRNIILNNNNIKEIDNLVVLKNGPYYKLVIEVSMNGNKTIKKAHQIIDNIEKQLCESNPRAKYISIHINPYKKDNSTKVLKS